MKISLFLTLMVFPLFAIARSYHIQGYDPYSNQHYRGVAFLTEDKNGVYQAKWQVHGRTYRGTGLREGDKVSFLFMLDDNSIAGVEVYKVEGDTLKGSFVSLGKSLIGYEILYPKQ